MIYSKKQKIASTTAFGILAALSMAHLLNDAMQSILTAVYPLIKQTLNLNFAQIGKIALVYQISASIFQPVLGYYLDKRPNAWFLPIGMLFTMAGLLGLAFSTSFEMAACAVFFSGIGSSVLHPEASRLVSLASGGRKGLAQSVFQVGGSTGWAFGPLLAALFISNHEQRSIAVFSVFAVIAIIGLIPVCRWYSAKLKEFKKNVKSSDEIKPMLAKKTIFKVLGILLILLFSKYLYTASISNYYTFYLMEKFDVSVKTSQIFLFAFLFSAAIGTLLGGPIGDKIGRRLVIWFSILGASPFALLMPHANLFWTLILSMLVGFIISSAFSAMLIYAQETLPMKVGMISGLFFGLAFGIAGVSSAMLGELADLKGLSFVYNLCSFMPLIGIIAYFLPRVRNLRTNTENKP